MDVRTPWALLRQLRREEGLTQKELARAIGLSPSYLSQVETDNRSFSAGASRALRDWVVEVVHRDGDHASTARALLDHIEEALAGDDTSGRRPVGGAIGPQRTWLGLLAPGITRQVDAMAIAQDDDTIWVDPAAEAGPVVQESGGIRVRRTAAGELHVDLSTAMPGDVGRRDPRRHFIPATRTWALEGDPPPYDEYIRTTLDLTVGSRRYVVGGDDQEEGFPPDVALVHVVSAENPHPRQLSPEENARRMAALETVVAERLGVAGESWDRGSTRAPGGGTELDERVVVLLDQARSWALELAGAHGQTSIFEWTPSELRLIDLAGKVFSRPLR